MSNLGATLRTRSNYSQGIGAILVIGVGSLAALASVLEVLSVDFGFVSLTLLLIVYLWMEISRLRRLHPDRWLLNPVVVGSIFSFVLAYGVTNVIMFLPQNQRDLVGVVDEITPAMVKLMWLALVGAVGMWMGYWSVVADPLSRPHIIAGFQSFFLPKTDLLRPGALLFLVSVATGARLIQIRLGVFGYSSDIDRLFEMGSITQYLAMASGLGKVALVFASLRYYSPGTSRQSIAWLIGIIVLEVVFGFLSGFKSAVVMPFVIVGMCQYLRQGKISGTLGMLAIAGLLAAYALIEPFRTASNENMGSRDTSVVRIVDRMFDVVGPSSSSESASILLSTASRLNLTAIGSLGIAFADDLPSLPPDSPAFLADIFLAPAHALIPRIIWKEKPLGDLGLWYNQVVVGNDFFSSTAMGPLTYLYFAGGFVAVYFGFFFIGIVQRGLLFLTQPDTSLAGGVVFLTMLGQFSIIDSAFNGIIISLFRDLPLTLLLQFVIFKAGRR